MVIVASGGPVNLTVLGRSVRTGLAALGWRAVRDGAPLDEWRAFAAARNTWTALVRLGALPEDGDRMPSAPAGPAGIQLARAALLRR